jgi:hypothetical protein
MELSGMIFSMINLDEVTRKTTKNLEQRIRYPNHEPKPGPPEYDVRT